MNKINLIGISILAVVILISASLTSVVVYGFIKASTDEKNTRAQVCFFNYGKKDNTILLDQNQAEKIEFLLKGIYSRMDNTSSRDEAQNIVQQGINELKAFGVFKNLISKQFQEYLPFVNSLCIIYGSCSLFDYYHPYIPIGLLTILFELFFSKYQLGKFY